MATAQQEFDAGAVLRDLYEDIPYVKKVAYDIDEDGGKIVVRVVFDAADDDDIFHARAMTSVEKILEFEDRMPGKMKSTYHVVPLSAPPTPAGMDHFRSMRAVLDR